MLDELESRQADPLKVRDFWLDTVVPAERAGKLDKIPARKPANLREASQAHTQNYYLTRRSFNVPDMPHIARQPRVSPFTWDEAKGWVPNV